MCDVHSPVKANATTDRPFAAAACKPQTEPVEVESRRPAPGIHASLLWLSPDSTSHSLSQVPDAVAFPPQHRGCTLCAIPCCLAPQPRLRFALCRLHLVAIEPNQANPASSLLPHTGTSRTRVKTGRAIGLSGTRLHSPPTSNSHAGQCSFFSLF